MGTSERFDAYLDHLAAGLGHADRHAGLRGYCTGLMLPLARKSVEPMAASIDPLHASAKHQSLHHFVAKAEWSDEEMLRRVAQWVVPQMDFSAGGWWIVDDTGFPKKGMHSVGVARQYCGMLGKQDNCQVAVSVSLACAQGVIVQSPPSANSPQPASRLIQQPERPMAGMAGIAGAGRPRRAASMAWASRSMMLAERSRQVSITLASSA
jgi:SRSO17 transposase